MQRPSIFEWSKHRKTAASARFGKPPDKIFNKPRRPRFKRPAFKAAKGRFDLLVLFAVGIVALLVIAAQTHAPAVVEGPRGPRGQSGGGGGGSGAAGANGGDGFTALVEVFNESAGVNCADGGQKVLSGLDNGDGGGTARDDALQAGEVDNIAYICNGSDGVLGGDGYTTLLTQTVESPGVNCPNGGYLTKSGLDNGDGGGIARDGILQTGEADSTVYICNGNTGATGATGADGYNTIFLITAESAGANCANAGKKVQSGLDNGDGGGTARDGTLQAGEVDSTVYICNGLNGSNGTDGYNTIFLITAESAGANCANAGKKLQSGLDNGDGGGTARDGTLQAGEVDATNYVCNGIDNGLLYTYSTGTSGDPGSGKFGFDTTTLSSIATLRISETDGDGNGLASFIATWDDSTSTGHTSTITVLGNQAPTRILVFKITGTLTDNGAYDSFPVTYITSSGTHANNDVDRVRQDRTGEAGFNTIFAFAAEAAGANCNTGGLKVTSGLDNGDGGGTARDGTLQAGEVDATNYVCNGSPGNKVVTFSASGGSTAGTQTQWTNMPVAFTEYLGDAFTRLQVNLTNYRDVRFGVDVSVASAANAFLLLQYSTNNGTGWSNACGATCPEVNVGATGSKWTAWQTMNSTMAADVLLRVMGQNGDGALDPTFRNIYAEFR